SSSRLPPEPYQPALTLSGANCRRAPAAELTAAEPNVPRWGTTWVRNANESHQHHQYRMPGQLEAAAGGTAPETELSSRWHHQPHDPGAPGQLERDETPDPVRSGVSQFGMLRGPAAVKPDVSHGSTVRAGRIQHECPSHVAGTA